MAQLEICLGDKQQTKFSYFWLGGLDKAKLVNSRWSNNPIGEIESLYNNVDEFLIEVARSVTELKIIQLCNKSISKCEQEICEVHTTLVQEC